MADELDRILQEIQRQKGENPESIRPEELKVDPETAQQVQAERQQKVSSFKINLNLEDEFGQPEPSATPQEDLSAKTAEASQPSQPAPTAPAEDMTIDQKVFAQQEPTVELPALAEEGGKAVPEKTEKEKKGRKKRQKNPKAQAAWGCVRGLLYAILVIGISLSLACIIILGVLDLFGLNKPETQIEVTIPRGAGTREIAERLKEAKIIDQPLFFLVYSRLTGSDGSFQPGTFLLSPDMGYSNIISILKQGTRRETVRVTFPEGYTIDEIAVLLAKNGVCSEDDFYHAVRFGDYSDYDFVKAIPTKETDPQYADRVYALEGYLFPDTYEFYTGSSGETVVRKFLDNFKTRINSTYRARIADKGYTIDQVVILASIVQGESARGEWSKVARVLKNRLDNPQKFPKLECDATQSYVKYLRRDKLDTPVNEAAYDTYVRKGLPVGPICNPGLNAIDAVLSPSDDKTIAQCFYFATDMENDVTYYSKTLAEHEAICRKYKIGMYK